MRLLPYFAMALLIMTAVSYLPIFSSKILAGKVAASLKISDSEVENLVESDPAKDYDHISFGNFLKNKIDEKWNNSSRQDQD